MGYTNTVGGVQVKAPAKEKPISFADDMIRAFLADRKDTTRRIVIGINHAATISAKPHSYGNDLDVIAWDFSIHPAVAIPVKMPYLPGMRVWVRETWRVVAMNRANRTVRIQFKADLTVTDWIRIPDAALFNTLYKQTEKEARRLGRLMNTWDVRSAPTRWRPGRFMPRCIAREFAVIESIHPERVQDITEADAVREGFTPIKTEFHDKDGGERKVKWAVTRTAQQEFMDYFDRLNQHRGEAFTTAANPWVWVIRFRREKEAHNEKQ